MKKSLEKFNCALPVNELLNTLIMRRSIFLTLKSVILTLMNTLIFFLLLFLRDQNSKHFNEDLLAVNGSAFSFVLCFKASVSFQMKLLAD